MTKENEMDEICATYFVVGAGAMGMAFVDQVLHDDPECTVLLVDRYGSPGGHWTVAYPFVRLHQPSCAYGVNSMRLGSTDWVDPEELATGREVGLLWSGLGDHTAPTQPPPPTPHPIHHKICQYFLQVLGNFQSSGRVRWFPKCEGNIEGSTFTTAAGKSYSVVADKIVDATYMKVEVPSVRFGRS